MTRARKPVTPRVAFDPRDPLTELAGALFIARCALGEAQDLLDEAAVMIAEMERQRAEATPAPIPRCRSRRRATKPSP